MNAITYTNLRQNLKKIMDQICDHHEPYIITRQKGGHLVMMSLEDYHALEETLYLMKSPANLKHLLKSIQAAEKENVPG